MCGFACNEQIHISALSIFPPLSLFLSISLSHTYTHTHSHTYTQTHTLCILCIVCPHARRTHARTHTRVPHILYTHTYVIRAIITMSWYTRLQVPMHCVCASFYGHHGCNNFWLYFAQYLQKYNQLDTL